MTKYKIGNKVCVPLGQKGQTIACGRIISKKMGRFRKRKTEIANRNRGGEKVCRQFREKIE